MRSIRYICLAFLLCLRAIPAQAEIAHETATRLLAVSGMAAVLQRLPAQMRDGFRKGFDVNSESTSPGQRAQIEAALEGAYSTDRMQASVLDRVRRGSITIRPRRCSGGTTVRWVPRSHGSRRRVWVTSAPGSRSSPKIRPGSPTCRRGAEPCWRAP